MGIVVFVHELGHFLFGKLFGVRIEEFSIGFGPKAISFTKNDTVYRINWLPLGGYVRFYGADLSEPLDQDTKHLALQNAKLYQRALIAFAGPLFNFLLSFVILACMSWVGLPDQPSVVSVLPQSVAEQAGLHTGDHIVAIDNTPVRSWSDLTKIIGTSAQKKIDLSVERNNQTLHIAVIPKSESLKMPYGTQEPFGRIGITPVFSPATIVAQQGQFWGQLGLTSDDQIVSVNNTPVQYLYQVIQAVENSLGVSSDQQLGQKIQKGLLEKTHLDIALKKGRHIVVSFDDPAWKHWANTALNPVPWQQSTVASDQTVQSFAKANNPWQQCGLSVGDTIVSISEFGPIRSAVQIEFWLEGIKDSAAIQKTASKNVGMLLIDSNGKDKKIECKIPVEQITDQMDVTKKALAFPVEFKSAPVAYPKIDVRADSFEQGIKRGFEIFSKQALLIYNGVKALISGHIPLSNLGGPIAIANVAGQAAKAGLTVFFLTMSMLSVNIGMMNLLPLPALDGGMLLLYAVEALYGKPLPVRIQIMVQRVGVFILLSLFVLVFYNDILRLFHNWNGK